MKQIIKDFLAAILEELQMEHAGIAVEVPENPSHGDYTTNVAMLLSGRLKAPPLKVAQQIVDQITKHQSQSRGKNLEWFARAEIAPPGFINLWLSEAYFGSQIKEVLEKREQYGRKTENEFRVQSLEFRDKKQGEKRKPASASKTKSPKLTKSVQLDQFGPSSAGKAAKTGDVASFGKTTVLSSRPPSRDPSDEKDWLPGQARNDNVKKIMVEFAHPNTHKAFHIGHLRNITTGEAIVRLLESQENRVIRANYQGDVGMHIAKCLYGILEIKNSKLKIQNWQDAKKLSVQQKVEYLGEMYAAGSKAFEDDKKAQETIIDLNALIYASAQRYAKEVGRNPGTTDYLALVKNHVHPLDRVYALWKETRQWSLDYFETIYQRVGSRFDRLYFESECLSGVDAAKEAVKRGVLKESDGAIVFDGKAYGLDTRVFVNSLGLPTYEGKEQALSRMETTEFGHLDRLIHVVGPEQASFFAVTFKAEELLGIVTPGVQHHLVYGWVKLKKGKMSSRLGNVVLGEWLLDEAKKEIYDILKRSKSNYKKEEQESIAEACAVAAVKYAFLRVGTKQEIAFDLAESVSFEGDSGPYLLYSYARAKSVLRKASSLGPLGPLGPLNPEERSVARRIAQFPDVVAEAARNFTPNTLATYLFHLASEFNLFYAKHEILGNAQRLALTAATAQVLKNGLYLLGIPTIERM